MLPRHLHTNRAQGLVIHEPIAQFEIGSFQNFVYLVLDWANRKAVIVDPQKDLSRPLQALSEHDFELTGIWLTHTHYDHVGGVAPLLKREPHLQVRAGERDLGRLSAAIRERVIVTRDGDRFSVGPSGGSIEAEAVLTPGHTAGAVSYFIPSQAGVTVPYLWTGDTIFIRDCGRTDLEGGSNDEMFSSIQRIKRFPPETVLLVGHHYARECATTLADELKNSPPFLCKNVAELAALL